MAYYEHVFIARQDVSAPQVEGLTEDFSKLIEEQGGKVTKKEYWGLRSLAYKINKNRKGHYVLINLDAVPDTVLEMERQMRLNEDVLRYLTIRVDELEEGPSVIMQRGSGRDDRPRRSGRDDRHQRPARDAAPAPDQTSRDDDANGKGEDKAPADDNAAVEGDDK
ncbi:MAG: 30S ribosomal protein S6 [Rhodospirillales bacterium]|nr:30S ribosomal protein S6 [Rhodospirillales bacterium]